MLYALKYIVLFQTCPGSLDLIFVALVGEAHQLSGSHGLEACLELTEY